jgi:hypothetical protein
MQLYASRFAIRQAHRRNTLTLSPSTLSVHLPQVRANLDARASRNGLDLFDRADDFELHDWIVNEKLRMGKAG